MTSEEPDEAAVVDELYAGSRDEFLATRTERVKRARAAGDRDLATRLGALRKPTVAAWLVNQLVRRHQDDVDALTKLAAELADAHRHGSGEQLRAAGEQRRELLRGLEIRTRELAAQRITEDVVNQVSTTFQAALIDPNALAAVQTGALSTAVELGADVLDQWPAVEITRLAPKPAPAPPKQAKQVKQTKPAGPAPELVAARDRATAAVRAREQAEQALADVQQEVTDADERLTRARTEFDAAREAHDQAREAVTAAKSAVTDAVREENAAERAAAALEH